MLFVFIIVGVVPLYIFSYTLLNNYEEKALSNKYNQMQNQIIMLSIDDYHRLSDTGRCTGN